MWLEVSGKGLIVRISVDYRDKISFRKSTNPILLKRTLKTTEAGFAAGLLGF